MKPLVAKIKPSKGFSHVLHLVLVALLPIMVFVLVRIEFIQLAFSVVLLSKWRMLAVRPRFWPANVRANAVDILVGLSIVVFMSHTSSALLQLLYAAL